MDKDIRKHFSRKEINKATTPDTAFYLFSFFFVEKYLSYRLF